MLSREAVDAQLKRIGCNFKLWGRSEINELDKILIDDEVIAQCVNGEYSGGFAMLVATNHRVLLVDKKPFLYLTVEDVRFDLISEFSYNHRMVNGTIKIFTPNKTLNFTSWNQRRLRKLLEYVQHRVLEMRQQQQLAQQFQAAAGAQLAQWQVMNQRQQPSFYVPNMAHAPQQNTPLDANNNGLIDNNEKHGVAARLAAQRTALGTYTRSKLPSFRHHHGTHQQQQQQEQPQNGEIYPSGYPAPAAPGVLSDFQVPFEY